MPDTHDHDWGEPYIARLSMSLSGPFLRTMAQTCSTCSAEKTWTEKV